MAEILIEKTALELAKLLETGGATSRQVTEAFLERIEKVDTEIHAFNSWDAADALAQADASDARRKAGKTLGKLDGVPVALKDVIAVKDQPLTCSSKMLAKYVSPYDAHVVEKLKGAGAVLLGRLNMDEFAMGSSTENSATGTTKNPWNHAHVPGGSSGGSAASLAACEVPLTLGSDTGGSIRQPAALCGVVGMKPTYGLVSRYGLAAFASSLDQIGPLARTVEDAAALLQIIAGHDGRDSTSLKVDIPNYAKAVEDARPPKRIGVPKEFFGEGLSDSVRKAVEDAVEFYKTQGCEVVDISLPHNELSIPVYYVLATAEASSNLARYDGVLYSHRSAEAKDAVSLYFKSRAEGFGDEVKRRIILGTYVLSSGYYDAYYLRAQKVRTLIRQDFETAFEQVDAIVTPVTPTTAFKFGEKATDPLAMYLSDIYTISTNLAGLPALSIPCGQDENKLPIGLHLIGKPFDEAALLGYARLFETHHKYANLHA